MSNPASPAHLISLRDVEPRRNEKPKHRWRNFLFVCVCGSELKVERREAGKKNLVANCICASFESELNQREKRTQPHRLSMPSRSARNRNLLSSSKSWKSFSFKFSTGIDFLYINKNIFFQGWWLQTANVFPPSHAGERAVSCSLPLRSSFSIWCNSFLNEFH